MNWLGGVMFEVRLKNVKLWIPFPVLSNQLGI